MFRRALSLVAILSLALPAQRPGGARTPRSPLADPIPTDSLPAYVRRTPVTQQTLLAIWNEGMNRSQAMRLSQQLMDGQGARLTGSPESDAAQEWLVRTYTGWGVTARRERYGTWNGWRQGVGHVDLISPRVRSLDARVLAWSPSTGGRPVEGEVVTYPMNVTTPEEFEAWLPNVRGKIFLMSVPRLSCRSSEQWDAFALAEEDARVDSLQRATQIAWNQTNTAMNGGRSMWLKLRDAGAIAVFSHSASNHPGIQKVFGSQNQTLPTFGLSCEDYGLLFRLAQNGQAPRARAFTDSEVLGERDVFNVVAEIRGRELPNEYVMLSAHFDSWAGASGATDNGTGTITMLEALRILKQVYPNPRRTILVGHWNGEEQGLNGSRAFSEDHPEVITGLQALFNQDNGTGRVVNLSAGPFPGAAVRLESYLGQLPAELTRGLRFVPLSAQSTGGTDHASFVCHKTPAFSFNALDWDYGLTSWHTDRDTYDKVVESDLKHNAVLTAMMVYLASEDPQRMPRDLADPLPRSGFGQQNNQPAQWQACRPAQRQSPAAVR